MKWLAYILGIVAFEASSLAAWMWPESSMLFLVVWGLIALTVTWRSIHAGLGFMAIDLLIDPMGRMLVFGGVSGRMVLFGVILFVWLLRQVCLSKAKCVQPTCHPGAERSGAIGSRGLLNKILSLVPRSRMTCLKKFGLLRDDKLVMSLVVFLLIIAAGVLRGFAAGYSFGTIVGDANGFAFLLLILVVLTCHFDRREKSCAVSSGSLTSVRDDTLMKFEMARWSGWVFSGYVWLCVKSAFLFAWFSHTARPYFDSGMYRFFRDTRVAELTPLSEQGIRVFLQSHIYAALLLVVLVAGRKWVWERLSHRSYMFLLASSAVLVLMSLSRSMWLALGVVLIWFVWNREMIRDGLRALVLSTSILLLLFIPFGSMNGFVGMFAGRAAIESEFAAVSRWEMLPQLNDLIVQAPLVGYGFGFSTEIVGPSGFMTRTAFEWGWHDLIIKTGLVGTIAFLWLLFEVMKRVRMKPLILSIIALMLIHIFTPYLNHPLGIGWLIGLIYFTQMSHKEEARD